MCPSLTSRRRMEATASLVQRHSATTFTSSRCLHSSGLPSAREGYCAIFCRSFVPFGSETNPPSKRKNELHNFMLYSRIEQQITGKTSSKQRHFCFGFESIPDNVMKTDFRDIIRVPIIDVCRPEDHRA
jgi:hypothetical protein